MEEKWVQLVEAFNDVEAEIICGLLQSANIPCRKADRDALGYACHRGGNMKSDHGSAEAAAAGKDFVRRREAEEQE